MAQRKKVNARKKMTEKTASKAVKKQGKRKATARIAGKLTRKKAAKKKVARKKTIGKPSGKVVKKKTKKVVKKKIVKKATTTKTIRKKAVAKKSIKKKVVKKKTVKKTTTKKVVKKKAVARAAKKKAAGKKTPKKSARKTASTRISAKERTATRKAATRRTSRRKPAMIETPPATPLLEDAKLIEIEPVGLQASPLAPTTPDDIKTPEAACQPPENDASEPLIPEPGPLAAPEREDSPTNEAGFFDGGHTPEHLPEEAPLDDFEEDAGELNEDAPIESISLGDDDDVVVDHGEDVETEDSFDANLRYRDDAMDDDHDHRW